MLPEPRRPRMVVATARELRLVSLTALAIGLAALALSVHYQLLLLEGDAETYLGNARSLVDFSHDSRVFFSPKVLPLSSLLLMPWVSVTRLWQTGLAGAIPSLLCYIVATTGLYALARRLLPPRWALLAAAIFALNANLLYLSTTALTEPICIAMLILMLLSLYRFVEALEADPSTVPIRRLLLVGIAIWLATWSRYEGWATGALCWCVVAWQLFRHAKLRRQAAPWFAAFTLLASAGVILWLAYSQLAWHDWLQFLRGPYSVPADVKRVAPDGYPGKGDLRYAFLQYTLCARLMIGAWKLGWPAELLAAAGAIGCLTIRRWRMAFLLWVPLLFYVYSIRSGSLVIFVRPGGPINLGGVRYGIELLPAASLFLTYVPFALAERCRALWPRSPAFFRTFAFSAILANLAWMLYATPAMVQSSIEGAADRLALELPLADQLHAMPDDAPILFYRWGFRGAVGALTRAGFPFRRTIDPLQGSQFQAALETPALSAAYVVAMEGDAYSRAVEAHPEGLEPVTTLCGKQTRCVTIYRSTQFLRR